MDLSIKGVPEEQVRRLRERAKANHRSLQGELRAILDDAIGASGRSLSIDDIAAEVAKLGLTRRDEAARLIREETVTVKVDDASAVVALLFNELTREAIVDRLLGASLHAPLLLGFETANACLKKMRTAPGERRALLAAFSLLDELAISP